MEVPHLNEASYFSIPPRVTISELEAKLAEVGLDSNPLVKEAIAQAQLHHQGQRRNSGAPTLDEHILPVGMTVLAYQLFEKEKGNPNFAEITPEGIVVGLTHDTFDDGSMYGDLFTALFGKRIFDMVWPLTDWYYLAKVRSYREKIETKFRVLENMPWQSQVVGLADRLNQLLCYYTRPYINSEGQPTPIMVRGLSIAQDIVLPFAKRVSPDFFYPMFTELLIHYRRKYPSLRI